jgi:hypothetical protein
MADEKGFIDTEKIAEFTKTVETRWDRNGLSIHIIQQKWTNELGEEEWRDIPLVISDK